MGWLANRAMRGASNRAIERLASEWGMGPVTGLVALALGHACYPNANYGDNGMHDQIIGQLRSSSLKPCDSRTACMFMEQWLDKRTISTSDVFTKIWGMRPQDLVDRLARDDDSSVDEGLSKMTILSRLRISYKRLADSGNITAEEHTKFVGILSTWFETDACEIEDCETTCVRKFVEAELDFRTTGSRGMGRVSEEIPRLGAKFRSNFASASTRHMTECGDSMEELLFTGFMLAEYMSRQTGGTCPKIKLEQDALLLDWVPTIFRNGVAREFEECLEKPLSGGYQDFFRPVWLSGPAQRVNDAWEAIGIPNNEYTVFLIHTYLDAGISLRFCQAHS